MSVKQTYATVGSFTIDALGPWTPAPVFKDGRPTDVQATTTKKHVPMWSCDFLSMLEEGAANLTITIASPTCPTARYLALLDSLPGDDEILPA